MTNKLQEAGISWLILGSQTKPYRPPRIEWVKEIVEACDKAGIPVFLKDNLEPLLRGHTLLELEGLIKTTKGQDGRYTWRVRQELPKGGEDARGNLKGNSQRIRLYS